AGDSELPRDAASPDGEHDAPRGVRPHSSLSRRLDGEAPVAGRGDGPDGLSRVHLQPRRLDHVPPRRHELFLLALAGRDLAVAWHLERLRHHELAARVVADGPAEVRLLLDGYEAEPEAEGVDGGRESRRPAPDDEQVERAVGRLALLSGDTLDALAPLLE